MRALAFLVAIGLGLVACSGANPANTVGSQDQGVSSDDTSDDDDDADPDAVPTFHTLYTSIFAKKCIGCHGSKDGLNLNGESTAFADLVGVMAADAPCSATGDFRVKASDAADSLLYQKVTGKNAAGVAVCGKRMPLTGHVLTTSQITKVKTWINNGAKR